MAKVTPVQNPFVTFMLLPRQITLKQGRTKLRLAASVDPSPGLNVAEVIASVKYHKSKITYSNAMKQFMRTNGYQKSDFKPLDTYLLTLMKQADKNPQIFLSLLSTYLASGQAPTFSVVIPPAPPSPPSLTTSSK